MKVYIYGTAYYSDGSRKTSRNFVSAEAFSRWANAQYRKDEKTTVYQYEFNLSTCEIRLTCTWHA